MLDVDRRLWLPDDLLMKMDKMSMAASIEARVPFLNHLLVEWAARLPERFKVHGSEGKVLLKRLARRLLPREVVDRPKVAEQQVWVQRQFRDGNGPAQSGVRERVQQSVATLRALGRTDFAVRSDSAGYPHGLLDWLRAEPIPFAISADLSPQLKARSVALPESWSAYRPRRLRPTPRRSPLPGTPPRVRPLEAPAPGATIMRCLPGP